MWILRNTTVDRNRRIDWKGNFFPITPLRLPPVSTDLFIRTTRDDVWDGRTFKHIYSPY